MLSKVYLYFTLFFFLVIPIRDITILSEFRSIVYQNQKIVEENISKERLASKGIDSRLTLICLSSCEEDTSTIFPLVRYRLQSVKKWILINDFPHQTFTYNRL